MKRASALERMNRITSVLTVGAVGIITTEFGIVGLLPDIAVHFGISIDYAGSLISLFAIAVAISGPLVTLLVSRHDRKKVLQVALMVFILSNILSALSGSFTVLLLARVLPAFFLTAYFATALVVAVESVEKSSAIKAVTTIYGGLSIATVIGIPLTAYIAAIISWRDALWLPAAINVIALVGISFIVPSMPGEYQRSYGDQLRILKKGRLWLNLMAVFAMAAGSFSVYSYFADYLEKVFVMTKEDISLMLMVFGIAGVAGNWMAGVLLSKSLYTAVLIYILAMIVLYLSLYSGSFQYPFHAIVVALWGFIHMSGFVISQAWVSAAAEEAPALANSLVVSTANGGIALGAALGGAIISSFGIHQVPWGGIGAFAFALLIVGLQRIMAAS